MAISVGTLVYNVKMDTVAFEASNKKVQSDLKQTSSVSSQASKSFGVLSSAGKYAGVALGGVGAAAFKAADMASDLNESMNVVTQVMGSASDEMIAWSETSIQSMGMSQTQALKTSGTFAAMGQSLGLSTDQAGDMAMSLTQLSADLASFYNISQDQAATALKGIFTGETDSLKNLGIMIDSTTLKQYGYNDSMSSAEKVNIRYKAVIDQTEKAQGDFARTSDGMANATRIAKGEIQQLATDIGQQLLPYVEKIINKFNDFVESLIAYIEKNPEVVGQVLKVVGAISVFLGVLAGLFIINVVIGIIGTFVKNLKILSKGVWAVTKAIGKQLIAMAISIGEWVISTGAIILYEGAQLLAAAATWVMNAALVVFNVLLSPIGLIILGIIVVIVILVLVIMNWAKITDWVSQKWSELVAWFTEFWDWLTQLFVDALNSIKEWVMNIFNSVVTWIEDTWNGVTSFFSGLWDTINQIFSNALNWLYDNTIGRLEDLLNWILDWGNKIKDGITGALSFLNPFDGKSMKMSATTNSLMRSANNNAAGSSTFGSSGNVNNVNNANNSRNFNPNIIISPETSAREVEIGLIKASKNANFRGGAVFS